MLQQPGYVVIKPVMFQTAPRNQCFCINLPAEVNDDAHPFVERCQPLRHQPTHGHADRADTRRIDVFPGTQIVDQPIIIVNHHAP